MEKNKFFMNEEWNSSNYGMEIQSNELNCTQEQQLSSPFFNPNWDNSMDQGDPFESALSSIVSSPAAEAAGGESFVLRELIGRLGSICNSGEVTPKSYTGGHNSTNNSCYSTPLNSPPKLNLSTRDHHHHQIRGSFQIPGNQFPFPYNSASFSTDPGFTDRAARFSSLNGQFGLNESEFSFPPRLTPIIESGKLSSVSSNQSVKVTGSEKKSRRFSRSSTPENGEFGDSRENSSVSEQIPGGEIGMKAQNDGIGRKRKSIPRGKGKETQSSSPSKVVAGESEESNSKRSKSDDENGKEKEDSEEKEEHKRNGKSGGEGNEKQRKENEKTQEPPKDYIHVRARRGQATDSHSLAERVRREKISERMKFLQDLVPGCNKVTGKAVMLDEIINYVQSLQRQVEFLSMKLSTVNPRMDFNMEALLSKNILQSGGSMAHSTYPLENSTPALPYGYQSLHSGFSNGIETPFSMKSLPHIDGFHEAASQVSTIWEDDLQSVVQMGFNQNLQQSFPGVMTNTHMKVEL